jgi:hypothetical protein
MRQIIHSGIVSKVKSGRKIQLFLMDDIVLMIDEKSRVYDAEYDIYKRV